ncbi:MAG: ABC transporter permease [Nitrospinaceae bacterium]|nr:ABC transporter permease [Nitrospinaceae bacterium]MBT3432605.1 ABC transporter permease [Nitrospinaceae bacterium]MBT4095363.1 ABC transporter permease [Nitrospinaceae bacterium]MBT4432440.1 ABC transporter permease [Nitrospinaceae bacterium]MBT5947591.1 ABC transporter permease [Nitrospinaceae bacterium]
MAENQDTSGWDETLAALGRTVLHAIDSVRQAGVLARDMLYWAFIAPWKRERSGTRWESVLEQGVRVGWEAVFIVVIINFFVGMISALQSASLLKQFGQLLLVANAVALSMTRELGPLLTAIIVAGRSGSAFAAEIGSMKMAEEIDALTTMGLNPVRFLMVPRVMAMMIAVPILTLLADFMGILGGWLLSITVVDLGSWQYIRHTMDAIDMGDVMRGLTKSFVFGFLIAMTGCYLGIKVEGGAEGVGRSTTNSVVVSIFLIIFANLIFTAFFYAIE